MAKIEDAKPKNVSGGYHRVFGIPALGDLLSRVQSTVISAGSELERIIISKVASIRDLDEFLKQEIMPEGVFIAPKKQIKKCKTLKFPEGEPDFMIFKRRKDKQACHVVELKDGHVFDTKKVVGERDALRSFISRNAQHMPYRVSGHFCCFNQGDVEDILIGFKNRIDESEAMTGRQFCELLEINYDEIVESRKADQPANVRFFIKELMKIDEIRDLLKKP